MTNIERAIERLNDVMYLREINYAGEQVTVPVVNLNDCRAEIVALMRELSNWYEDLRPGTLAALAAKILGEQG